MWFTASSVTATNNSNVVKINSNESIANVKPGDALIIGSFNPVEILKAYASDQGSFIQLAEPWTNATQTQVPALVLPTRSALNEAITAINGANKLVNDNYKAILDWQTKTGEVTFKNLDNQEVTVKTAKQLELDVKAVQPYPWAFRKKDIEVIRAQNIDKYEASGFVHKGKVYGNWGEAVAAGLFVPPQVTGHENKLYLGSDRNNPVGDSETNHPVLHMAGVVVQLKYLGSNNPDLLNAIKFPAAEDGRRTYDDNTGSSVVHANAELAFLAETQTNKVVTDRVDVWGGELCLREINESDPNVYAFGIPQSQANHINGVPTTVDDTRPDSYFAYFTGDTSSRGRRVNWLTATEAERIAIGTDIDNWIYYDDSTGKWYQWTLKARSFAGAGNGDWFNVDVMQLNGNSSAYLDFQRSGNCVRPQGVKDTVADEGWGYPIYAANVGVDNHPYNYKGVFGALSSPSTKDTSSGVNGECYFLVCGTINRLNKGAYHPLNPFGSNRVRHLNGNSSVTFDNPSARKVQKLSDCFDFYDSATNPNGIAAWIQHGSLVAVTFNGRPDLRCHDVIYASGQGGVCRDMRLKADGLSLAELAEHDLKVKSGEYRGVEKLKFTTIHTSPSLGALSHNANIKVVKMDANQVSNKSVIGINALRGEIGQNLGCYLVANSVVYPVSYAYQQNANEFWVYIESDSLIANGEQVYLVRTDETNTSIAGEYMHADVFGLPVDLLKNDLLKNGWIGGYSLDFPDGTNDKKRLTRPVYSSESTSCQYYNEASGWLSTSSAHNISELTSTVNHATVFADGNVAIVNYLAKAKMTRSSDNLKILGGYKGIGSVFCCSFYASTSGFEWGKGLAYSLSDVVMVSNNSAGNLYSFLSLNDVQLRPDTNSLEETPFRKTTHQPISIVGGAPINGIARKGLKALDYVVEINGQAFICYAYAELLYDSVAGNWGDDAQVHIVDGQSTIIDLNGHIARVGTAIIVETLGWVKNAA